MLWLFVGDIGMLENIDWIALLPTAWDRNPRSTTKSPATHSSHRRMSFEPLESRQMLSANIGDFAIAGDPSPVAEIVDIRVADDRVADDRVTDDNALTARDQNLAISAIHLLVGGQKVTITSLDQIVELNVGDELQVVGIDYRLQGSEVVSGKIAFEGYLNKLKGSDARTDYRDGRFGRHVSEGIIPSGTSVHPGLETGWKMEAGTESLTLVMVRYDENGATIEDRVNIRTQVGQPDFVIGDKVRIAGRAAVGRKVRILGAWGNEGEGTYRNYAEVNIYHESDPNKIVWAGTLSDVVEAGEFDKGQFLNTNDKYGFSKRWIPEQGGTFVLKFYADPENQWNETNEDNNVFVTKVEISELRNRGNRGGRSDELRRHSEVEQPAVELAFAETVRNSGPVVTDAQLSPSPKGQAIEGKNLDLLSETLAGKQSLTQEIEIQSAATPQKAVKRGEAELLVTSWADAVDTVLSRGVN